MDKRNSRTFSRHFNQNSSDPGQSKKSEFSRTFQDSHNFPGFPRRVGTLMLHMAVNGAVALPTHILQTAEYNILPTNTNIYHKKNQPSPTHSITEQCGTGTF